jgi:hypothetical protein
MFINAESWNFHLSWSLNFSSPTSILLASKKFTKVVGQSSSSLMVTEIFIFNIDPASLQEIHKSCWSMFINVESGTLSSSLSLNYPYSTTTLLASKKFTKVGSQWYSISQVEFSFLSITQLFIINIYPGNLKEIHTSCWSMIINLQSWIFIPVNNSILIIHIDHAIFKEIHKSSKSMLIYFKSWIFHSCQ